MPHAQIEGIFQGTDYMRIYRRDHLDMSLPFKFQSFNKTGMRQMIKRMKYYLFADGVTLTKEVTEAFFDDASNFLRREEHAEE